MVGYHVAKQTISKWTINHITSLGLWQRHLAVSASVTRYESQATEC